MAAGDTRYSQNRSENVANAKAAVPSPRRKRWTADEKEFARRLFVAGANDKDVGRALGRGASSVRNYREQQQLLGALAEAFLSGRSYGQIAQQHGLSRNAVSGRLWRAGITRQAGKRYPYRPGIDPRPVFEARG